MRNVLLLLFFSFLSLFANGQNSFIGYRYALPDYESINKVMNDSGYSSLDNEAHIICFGSSTRKKKTSVGVEFFSAISNQVTASTGNVSKLNMFGILLATRSALNKGKKSIFSVVFNFGYQKTDLLFYNEKQVKDLKSILDNKEIVVKAFKKNELIGQIGLGYDWIGGTGLGFGIDAGYQVGLGKWKYLNLNYPEFPKPAFGHFYGTIKIYFGKRKKKSNILPKRSPEPTGPMTFVK